MFQKFIKSIEPFALTLIILAGANLAGWVSFTNSYWVGVMTVFCGILLTVNHIASQLSTNKPIEKKGKLRPSTDKSA